MPTPKTERILERARMPLGGLLVVAGAFAMAWGAYLLHPAAGYGIGGLVLFSIGNELRSARRTGPRLHD